MEGLWLGQFLEATADLSTSVAGAEICAQGDNGKPAG